MLKVDGGGGSSPIQKQTEKIIKPAINPTTTNTTSNPQTNAAVYAKGNQTVQQANILRYRLNAQIVPVALRSTPTVTPEDAQKKAEEIIADNGGKDNLNTDNAGRALAEIAKTNPADAQLIADEIYGDDRIKEEDRDEIAQSFTQALSDTELQELTTTREGQKLLQQIETNLHDYPVHSDEAADANRIRLALDRQGIFLGAKEGLHYESVMPVSVGEDPNATPEEVAAYVKLNPTSSYGQQGRYAFIDALQAHKGDADWLASFYSALGSEVSGQMISETLDPSTHQSYGGNGSDPQFGIAQTDLVRDSLETLQKAGKLNQDGMNALVNEMRSNPYIAIELFAKSSNNDLKAMFINAAINNGSDSWDAGALHVLNSMPPYKQEEILNGLGDKLNGFIQGAMAGQQEIFSFSDSIEYGIYGTTANEDLLTKQTYGGIEKLLETANHTTVYYHARVAVPDFTPELQTKLLDAVAFGLTNDDSFGNLENNVAFKDQLSRLAITRHNDLIKNQLDADGGATGEDFGSDFRDRYSKLIQMTLFTPPLGEQSGEFMKFVDSTYKGIADDLKNLDDQAFEAKYGRNRAAMARAYGQMTAVFFKALDDGLTAVKDDAKKAAAVMDPIFKLLDFGIGKGLDKAGPIGKVISTVLDLTGASSAAQDAIKSKIENGHIEDALEDMMEQGVDLSQLGEMLYEEVNNNLLPNASDPNGTYRNPDGTSVSIKDAWQNGYDRVEGAPQTS